MIFSIRMGGVFAQAVVHDMTSGGCADRNLLPICDWYMVTDVYTHPWIRGKGYATRVMQQVTNWADQQPRVGLYLFISPYESGEEIRSKKERARRIELLRQFYSKHGFIDHEEGMVRTWQSNK